MKFTLSESLFDDDFNISYDEPTISVFDEGSFDDYIDDNILTNSEPVGSKVDTNIPEGPLPGPNTGIADTLITAINDEWEAIQTYNSIIATLSYEGANNEQFMSMIPVIQDIVNEENKHVGQLQEILKLISPNTESIKTGEVEARGQFEFVNGKLRVEEHQPIQMYNSQNNMPTTIPTNPNEISTYCAITDVDDEV